MIETVVEQLSACLRMLDEHGLSVAAAHLSAAIESIQAELAGPSDLSEMEQS
ncbi:MAG: hypothetical protein ACKOOL_13360 [Novosphingobium sp.]